MSIIIQRYVSFWANKLNTSHWIKYANIQVFSGRYFPLDVPGFCRCTGKLGSEKTFCISHAYLIQVKYFTVLFCRFCPILICLFFKVYF